MRIDVEEMGRAEPRRFSVRIVERGGQTRHEVTLSAADFQRMSGGTVSAEEVISAAFGFLLDREPKESILPRFDLTIIARYFPDFEARLPEYLSLQGPP